MKKLPFDLEKALAGAPLVTRDGQHVCGFHRDMNAAGGILQFSAYLNGRHAYWNEDGSWHSGFHKFDLFLVDTGNPLVPALAGLIAASTHDLCATKPHNDARTALSEATGIPLTELTKARLEQLAKGEA